MDVILLILLLVALPILVVGGFQFLAYLLGGNRLLRGLCAVTAAACAFFLISEQFAEPVYGNKSALVGLGDLALGLLLIENLAVLSVPLIRRFQARDKEIAARWASMKTDLPGKNK